MGYYGYWIDACPNLPTNELERLQEEFQNLTTIYDDDWSELIELSKQYSAKIRVLECGDDEDVELGQPNMRVRFFDRGDMSEMRAQEIEPPTLEELSSATSHERNVRFPGWR